MKMTIEEFCRKHNACEEGMKWAVENCKTMNEVWRNAKPDWLIWVATREGVLTDKEVRLFAVWCARQVQHLMTDGRSIEALDVAERYANGNATDEELNEARTAAWWAARDAARDVPRDAAAANAVAWATARAAVRAACGTAWAAARDAAGEAAGAAAWWAGDAAGDAARTAQAEYLRTNCKPNFNL